MPNAQGAMLNAQQLQRSSFNVQLGIEHWALCIEPSGIRALARAGEHLPAAKHNGLGVIRLLPLR
jgi:hypothetical protein